MKTIALKSLSLRNFKGIKKLDLEFPKHENNLFGANATGKTTVFDAFTWILFGKDSTDRKDFNIKTLNPDGTHVEKIEHEVYAVLSVDGKEINLRRIYKENWVKKRGELEAELKGHETAFYIDDVPKKAGEYASDINEIMDEGVFKLITNPSYFPNMKWTDQREILFSISGTVSDQEVAHGNKAFTELLERLDGKKLEDYKLQVSSQKSKLKKDLEALPTRIDEAENAKPAALDFETISKEIKEAENRLSQVDKSIADGNEAQKDIIAKNKEIYGQINEIRKSQNTILAKRQDEIFAKDNAVRSERRTLEDEVRNYEEKIADRKRKSSQKTKEIEDSEAKLVQLRESFNTENSKSYSAEDGKLMCPVWNIVCGDQKSVQLNEQEKDKARKTFNQRKTERLAEINAEGKNLKNTLADLLEENTSLEKEISDLESVLSELRKKIAIYPSSNAVPTAPSGKDIPEWNELERKAAALEESLLKNSDSKNTPEELIDEKNQIIARLIELREQLGIKLVIERQVNRVIELTEEMKRVAQQISSLEKDEAIIAEFTRVKIDEAEQRINSRFSIVKFKLWERQINGAEVETCQAMVNGVPYSDANTASKINAGLDVINVLCKFYGATAPVFIDNRESVSEILDTESQVINLIVDKNEPILTMSKPKAERQLV